jgi:sulfoxide reductase heme-binding subunit YedZ
VASLVLLTIVVALGVANVKRLSSRRLPRFVVDGLHRNAALLAVAFLAIHVVTTVADSYVSIGLVNAVLPFTGSYKPFWVGLGALSLDLVLAVVLTSLLRRRIGYRVWRATHWLAYASWPVALVHSLGTGTDAGSGWMLALTGLCMLAVAVAVTARFRGDHSAEVASGTGTAGSKPRRPPAWHLTPAGGSR